MVKFGSVQVNRFGNQVSAYLGLVANPAWGRSKRESCAVYMAADEAREFALALLAAADEIEKGVPFTESRVGTYSAPIDGDRSL